MPPREKLDPELLKFCRRPEQAKVLRLMIEKGMSQAEAAAATGRIPSNVSHIVNRVKSYALQQGWSPDHDMVHAAPESHFVKGTSTLYGDDGAVKQQWVKTDVRREELYESLKDVAEAIAAEVEGKAKRVKPPKHCDSQLLAVYPMGDPHVGMYAWSEETGEDFDLSIARRDIAGAIHELVRAAPAAETAIILNLGDFFHADDQSNSTPTNHNPLDVDTRYAKVIRTGVAILLGVVDEALRKHKRVIVRNESGNHDPHSSLWLSIVLDAHYRNEPRIEVDTSPAPFWYFRFGKCLIGTTHGHSVKPASLAGVMAADRAEDWGQTQFRVWLHGHIHTTTRHEFPGCVVESFRTLAGKDHWHTMKGYRSGQDMNVLVFHENYGEVARHRVDIARIRESA